MLGYRLLAAAVLISVLLVFFWLDFQRPLAGVGGLWLLPVCLLLAAAGASELLRMLRNIGLKPIAWMVHVGNVAILASPLIPRLAPGYPADCPMGQFGWPLAALALASSTMLLGELWRYEKRMTDPRHLMAGVFVLVYLGVSIAFLVALRTHEDQFNGVGMVALLSLIMVVKMGDTGAYFGGRLFGGKIFGPTRPVRRLSPKKTYEGYLFGLVTSVAASWLVLRVIGPALSDQVGANSLWWGWVLYGLALALAGIVGDLGESYLKRQASVKDSSTWLPGLGGVLDILDSLLPAAPVAYLFWVAGLVG